MGVRIAVIGGASSYTPELFSELADHPQWPQVDQVMLVDLDTERLGFIQEVCSRLIRTRGLKTRVAATHNRLEAIAGADFVILQIRVGGLAARHRDETLPMEFGMVGNETTGPGGFVCALRTVPVALQIAREVERLSPQAWILNLTNPAGIVTEALLNHTGARAVGFCNIPINTTYALAELLGVAPDTIRLEMFGLNHLTWTRAAYVDGEERLQPLLTAARTRHSSLYQRGLVEKLIEPAWLQALGMIPGWYLRYFYCTPQVLEKDLCSPRGRAEENAEADQRIHRIYQSKGYGEEARRILQAKGGAQYYLPVLQVIDALVHDRGEVIVVDAGNSDAIPDLPADACVEVPARIQRGGVEPLPIGPLPLAVRGLVQAVKAYEQLAIEAAVTGSRQAALQALMAHPLVPSCSQAKMFLTRVLENERAYLPAFYSRS